MELWYGIHGGWGGQASVTCRNGCALVEPRKLAIDTFKRASDSVTYPGPEWGSSRLALMVVSQAPECEVVIEVLEVRGAVPPCHSCLAA